MRDAMAFGAAALPKKLTALLFFSFVLIHANPAESYRECWYGRYGERAEGQWCLEVRVEGMKPGECIVAGKAFTLSCRLEPERPINGWKEFKYAEIPNGVMKWYKDGQPKGEERKVDAHGLTYYEINSSQIWDSGNYTCKVTNWDDKNFESTISVNVSETAPKLTANQSSIRVKLNDSATLSCHVKGHAPSNFAWKHVGIKGVSNFTNLGKTSTINNTDSTMTLHLSSVTLDMRGIYECRALICSTEFAAAINLTVFDVPKISKVYAKAVGASSVCLTWTLDGAGMDSTKLSAVGRIENHMELSRYVKASFRSPIQNALIVDNLKNSTTYKFEVVFNTSAGDPFSTYSKWVTTLDRDFDFVPKLAIEGVTSNSIQVRASLPPVELRDLVDHYEIRLNDSERKREQYRWRDINSKYTITNLKKGTSYRLQVAACYACLGECGNFSDAEELSTAAKELDFVPQIQVTATTNNSISIGWERPSLAQSYRISKYKVKATSRDDIKGPIRLNRTADIYIFQNLKSNITYEIQITVCIFGNYKCEDWSAPVKADTISLDPGFVPIVSVCRTTSDSVRVVWTTPPEEQRNPVQQYKVEATNKNDTQGPVFFHNDVTSHTFGNLISGTTYQLRVAACSIHKTQCGDWSKAKNATIINQDPDPDFIPELEIQGVTLDSIDVRAPSLPVELQGWVDYYHVMVTDSEEGKQLHNWTNIDSMFSIRNLTSETGYRLRVAACNTCLGKCGNWSDEAEVSTAGKEFNYVANISVKATRNDSIKIGWNEPTPAEFYRILTYVVDATFENNTIEKHLDRRTVSHTFEHLVPNVMYEFGLTVCIYGSENCTEKYPSAPVKADTIDREPKFVPTVSVRETTLNSIVVDWTTPPEHLRGEVYRYKVMATNQKETRGPIFLSNRTTSFTFGALRSQTEFQLQVAACGIYIDQCGKWSNTEIGVTIDQESIPWLWPGLGAVAVVIVIGIGVATCLQRHREKVMIQEFNNVMLQRYNIR